MSLIQFIESSVGEILGVKEIWGCRSQIARKATSREKVQRAVRPKTRLGEGGGEEGKEIQAHDIGLGGRGTETNRQWWAKGPYERSTANMGRKAERQQRACPTDRSREISGTTTGKALIRKTKHKKD